jgi:hypothetical protein
MSVSLPFEQEIELINRVRRLLVRWRNLLGLLLIMGMSSLYPCASSSPHTAGSRLTRDRLAADIQARTRYLVYSPYPPHPPPPPSIPTRSPPHSPLHHAFKSIGQITRTRRIIPPQITLDLYAQFPSSHTSATRISNERMEAG